MRATCLCESVVLDVEHSSEFDACHCGMCRKWGGGPYLAVHCKSYSVVSGEKSIRVFDSSEWGQRGFCANCGTHLFYHLKPANEYIVPLGLLQSENEFTFKQQIFIDKKPNTYAFSNETVSLTEQQVFEKFGT